jgi:hypothetical protein
MFMIKDDIIEVIKELQTLPEDRLKELYALIHAFKLRFANESRKPAEPQGLAGALKDYAEGYIQTDQAVQQAWQETIHEKYHRP